MAIPLLTVCPSSLAPGFDTFSPAACRRLFDGVRVSHVIPFASPTENTAEAKREAMKNAGRLSLSGAQPKFGVVADGAVLRYSDENEQSTYILKPRPSAMFVLNAGYCAANENLTMQIASQVYRIRTAENAVCFFSDGEAAYITRRFDVHPGGKYAQEDFASLMGLTSANGGSDFKYVNGSYEECADIIREYVTAPMVGLLNFFRMLLFNFITLNDDAHLKNFSLIKRGEEYSLTPAYDLLNTTLHMANPRWFALDSGLFREGMEICDTHPVTYRDFQEFARRIGLPDGLAAKEIDVFSRPSAEAESLIQRSFLSNELKEFYRGSMRYRQSLLRP